MILQTILLSSVLTAQGPIQDPFAEIAVSPNSPTAWAQVVELMAAQGKPISVFNLEPPVKTTRDEKTGQISFEVSPAISNPDPGKPEQAIEGPAWMGYALSRLPQSPIPGQKAETAFQAELEGWKSALRIADKLVTQKRIPPKDPLLIQFSIFRRNNDLEAAIFLLFFDESFRPDFENWKKEHPKGIKSFIEKYRLRPYRSLHSDGATSGTTGELLH